jgi:hypothetical protein
MSNERTNKRARDKASKRGCGRGVSRGRTWVSVVGGEGTLGGGGSRDPSTLPMCTPSLKPWAGRPTEHIDCISSTHSRS